MRACSRLAICAMLALAVAGVRGQGEEMDYSGVSGTVSAFAVTTNVSNEQCPCCPRSTLDAICNANQDPVASLPPPCTSVDTLNTLAGKGFVIPDDGWQQYTELTFDPIKGFSVFGASRDGSEVNSVNQDATAFLTDPTGDSQSIVAKVSYVKGQYASDSGINFNAFPYKGSKTIGDEARLQYKVWFAPDFPWVLGGKLPGFYGGDTSSTLQCSGGAEDPSCWSLRIMWREGGRGELYAYFPSGMQTCELAGAPGVALQCETLAAGLCFGTSLGASYWVYPAGAWTTIDLYVKMNTVGQQDGVLAVAINGTTSFYYDHIVWRSVPNLTTNTVFFSTFFGGGSSRYAVPETGTAVALFKDFRVWGNSVARSSSSSSSNGVPAPATAPEAAPAPSAVLNGGDAGPSVSTQSLRAGGF